MAARALLATCLGLAAPLGAAAAYTPSKNVVVASDRDFGDKVVNSDKASFVWFLAPWCGHCKKLQPDYAKLADHYAKSDFVQIVEVDCTAGGEGSCQKAGVQGYPTLKYWTPTTKGGTYSSGRDFGSMKSFIDATLQTCNVKTLQGCQPNQVDFIKKSRGKTPEELQELRKEKDDALKALKKERKEAQDKLKEQEKVWSRNERNMNKAISLIKQLEKEAKKGDGKKKAGSEL